MNATRIREFVAAKWDAEIVPRLVEYIRIPNKSPMFDADWVEHGHMDRAVELMVDWAKAQAIPGMQVEAVRLEGRTPLIFIDIPAANGGRNDDCVLLYGHLDKQPE
ncbi:MAG TPA: peptidase M20, partial [Thermomonas sp.]|nr:peptidase M20 [Thermomonas sp.]